MLFTTQLEERMRTLVDQRLRRRLLILASMALGAVGASPSILSAQTGTIVGRVTDSRSGQGVQNVLIQIEGTRFASGTNVDGRYRLTSIPVGSHSLTARRIGYSVDKKTVVVPADREV